MFIVPTLYRLCNSNKKENLKTKNYVTPIFIKVKLMDANKNNRSYLISS